MQGSPEFDHFGGLPPHLAREIGDILDNSGEDFSRALPHYFFDHNLRNADFMKGKLGFGYEDSETLDFISGLRNKKEELTPKLIQLIHSSSKDVRAYNHAVYVGNAMVLQVFSGDPFAASDSMPPRILDMPTNSGRFHQKLHILDYTAKSTAAAWLMNHPNSEAAHIISEEGIYTLSGTHWRFIRELWPTVEPLLKAA